MTTTRERIETWIKENGWHDPGRFGYIVSATELLKFISQLPPEAERQTDQETIRKMREAIEAAIACHEAAERGETQVFPITQLREALLPPEAFAAADKASH